MADISVWQNQSGNNLVLKQKQLVQWLNIVYLGKDAYLNLCRSNYRHK